METGNVLSSEIMDIFARLRAADDAMPADQVKTTLTAAYDVDSHRLFKSVTTTPLAAAPIDQVHRATAQDRTYLALKP